jgi:hypothetical protein
VIRAAPTGLFVVVVLAIVGALALAVFLGVIDYRYSTETAAYDATPACSSTGDLSNCRFEGSGVPLALATMARRPESPG